MSLTATAFTRLVKSRAAPLGIEVTVCDLATTEFAAKKTCGILFQYPNTHGSVGSNESLVEKAKAAGAMTVCATDMLALTVLTPPGEEGVDIAVGSAQRMGVPLGYGGPHAAFISCAAKHMRKMPGRIIGQWPPLTITSPRPYQRREPAAGHCWHHRCDPAAGALDGDVGSSFGINMLTCAAQMLMERCAFTRQDD